MKRFIAFLQRILITLQLFLQNGLTNHAAACAYAFLLSLAPTMLMITFFIIVTFKSSPETISVLISSIPVLDSLYEEQWLTSDLFSFSMSFIPSIIFGVSLICAGSILAFSLHRGLRIIFPSAEKRSPLKDVLVTLAIEGSLVIFVLVVIISSRTALGIYRMLGFGQDSSFKMYLTTQTAGQILYISLFSFASFLMYIFVPVKPPKKMSAFWGSLLCGSCFFCVAFVLNFILDKGRYNILYGTLGNLIMILVNVFIFFIFFFIGAQFAYVRDTYKELPPLSLDVIFKKEKNLTTNDTNDHELAV